MSAAAAETNVYRGDTHLHTGNSFDVYLFGTTQSTPKTALRFASGQPDDRCAHATVALGIDPTETDKPLTIQERFYSQAIWYVPEQSVAKARCRPARRLRSVLAVGDYHNGRLRTPVPILAP